MVEEVSRESSLVAPDWKDRQAVVQEPRDLAFEKSGRFEVSGPSWKQSELVPDGAGGRERRIDSS